MERNNVMKITINRSDDFKSRHRKVNREITTMGFVCQPKPQSIAQSCPKCGKKMDKVNNHCPYCGFKTKPKH